MTVLPEWKDRLALTRRGALIGLRGALALRHRGPLAPALRHMAVALAGPRGVAALARVRAARAAHRARRARRDGARREAFLDFWHQTARRGALEGVAQAAPAPEAGGSDGSGSIDLAGDVSGWTIGLYDPEPSGAALYRWTDSLVLLRVRVPDGPRRARLLLEPARPSTRPARPAVTVDGIRVAVAATPESVEFSLPTLPAPQKIWPTPPSERRTPLPSRTRW